MRYFYEDTIRYVLKDRPVRCAIVQRMARAASSASHASPAAGTPAPVTPKAVTPKALEKFDLEGYAFDHQVSKPDRLVFRRRSG